MGNFIDPFEALPGANMLCECNRPGYKDNIFQARLIMNSDPHGVLMWLQSNKVMSKPQGLYWRYVIDDPEERRQEAVLWFSTLLTDQELQE
jgi:hypothetical protein